METLPFPVTVKTIRTSRSFRLRVLPNGDVVATCHPRASRRQLEEFIREHISWVEEKREQALKKQKSLIENRETLLLRGTDLEYRLQIKPQEKGKVELIGKVLLVTAPTEDDKTVRVLLEKWYKRQAKKHFEERVILLADVVDRGVVKVTIRSQRTRWGSCSNRSTISLNWRLIQTPDWVSDYVIYHELAHLTHMNHSGRFWQLVEDYYPNYKEAEKWLTKHHQLLNF